MESHKQEAAFLHIGVGLRVTGIHIANSVLPVASCGENESCAAIEKARLQNWCIVRAGVLWMGSCNLISST